MKKLLLIILTGMIIVSCENNLDERFKNELELNYKKFEKATCNFPSNEQFYLMTNFDLETLNDTISKTIDELFIKPELAKELNQHITVWLRDSLFATNSEEYGFALFDKINIRELESPIEYYTNDSITIDHQKSNKCLQTIRAMYTTSINGHDIKIEIIPTNGVIIKDEGEFRVQTTGRYIPQAKYPEGQCELSDLRYHRSLVAIDWFITFHSDYYFDKPIAIKISDSTQYYDSNWHGELIK